ncbi:MAG: ABC transporter permease [Bacillota bacterium]
MIKKIFKITSWEVMRNLRNKQFIIGIFLTPVLILIFGGLPNLIQRFDAPVERTFYYQNRSEVQLDWSENILENTNLIQYQNSQEEMINEAETNGADGYFIIDQEFFETGNINLNVFSLSATNHGGLNALLSEELQNYKLAAHDLSEEVIQEVTMSANLQVVSLEDDGTAMSSRIITAVIFGGGLFFLLITSGSMLLQSALQEKKEKMSEIILSSISSEQLMAGKIIGHFILGMIQIGVWFGIGIPLADYFFDLPLLESFFNPALPLIAVFALLGYLVFAALFVGIGATMEDLQSATNAQSMVFMLPVLPVLVVGPVFNNPGGMLARIVTYFPLTAPVISIVRIAIGEISNFEIAITLVILFITTILFTLAAAKIFRVGMLMYGKSASFKEMLRWLKY